MDLIESEYQNIIMYQMSRGHGRLLSLLTNQRTVLFQNGPTTNQDAAYNLSLKILISHDTSHYNYTLL